MNFGRLFKALGAGLLAGMVAALFMTMVMALLRFFPGIPLPAELGSDRFLPFLDVSNFLSLIFQFGGPTASKELALLSGFEVQVVVGGLIGALYAVLVELGRGSEQPGRFGISRRGGLFLVVAVAAIWVISLATFSGLGWSWSALGANNLGVGPPGWASVVTALGLLLAYSSYGLALAPTYGFITSREEPGEDRSEEPPGRPMGRRMFLAGAGGVVLALSSDWLTRRLVDSSTVSYDGTSYLGTDLAFVTPNDQFYIVTKNIIDPNPARAPWRLRVDGQVENPRTYSFEDLEALEPVEQEMTLKCISTGVSGGLMSNAVWVGVPLPRLLEEAGPRSGVVQIRFYGADGYTHLASFEKAMEDTTLIAYEMNGEELPQRHGFPARALVPGYYGEASVKWITGIELFDTSDVEAYYEKQGWNAEYVTTGARIDRPEEGQSLSLSQSPTIPMRGVAFAGDRGISQVEVSTDGGNSWQDANIDYEGTRLTWVFWSYDWQPQQTGDYQLIARATDGNGNLQMDQDPTGIFDGRSGYHIIPAQVSA